MTILFRIQGTYPDGSLDEARYFRSASALARSIETGYIRPIGDGEEPNILFQVKVFSDIPTELENFNHEVFYDLMDKYEQGFTFSEESPSIRAVWDPNPLTEAEKQATKEWRRRLNKASKAYRDELTQAIEACYP